MAEPDGMIPAERWMDTAIDLPDDIWGYEGDEVLVIDLPAKNKPKSVIEVSDVEPYAEQLQGKRLVLFRTGFEANKFSDPHTYEHEGLSFHPDTCRWLIENTDKVQCIGMDWLSIASPSNPSATFLLRIELTSSGIDSTLPLMSRVA